MWYKVVCEMYWETSHTRKEIVCMCGAPYSYYRVCTRIDWDRLCGHAVHPAIKEWSEYSAHVYSGKCEYQRS